MLTEKKKKKEERDESREQNTSTEKNRKIEDWKEGSTVKTISTEKL